MEDIKKLQEMTDRLLGEAKRKKKSAKSEKTDVAPRPEGYSYAESLDFSAPLGALNLYKSQGQVNWGPQTSGGSWIDDRPRHARQEAHGLQSAWEKLKEAVEPKVAGNIWEAADYCVDEAPALPPAPPAHVQHIQKAQAVKASPEKIVHAFQNMSPGHRKLFPSHFQGKDKVNAGVVMDELGAQEKGGPEAMARIASVISRDPQCAKVIQTMIQYAGPSEGADMDEKKVGFEKLKNKLAHQKGVKDPAALAASIGREKYGAKGMAKKSAAGHK